LGELKKNSGRWLRFQRKTLSRMNKTSPKEFVCFLLPRRMMRLFTCAFGFPAL